MQQCQTTYTGGSCESNVGHKGRKVEALKEGDEVIIIGGTHRGREGMLVGSTPKMYYVRVGRAQEVRVQKGNVTSYALLEKLVKALVLK